MTSDIVDTACGRLEGERVGAHWALRGIPYAAPPVGPLRFRAPAPVEPWAGVREAKRFGASPLQGAVFAPGVLAEGPLSEDCLYLNVFTPALDGAKRPVMFFIHGGAFTVGSASAPLYDGGKLAALHDIVVVTINYRVGALGFLALGDHGARWGAADNRGQLDQLAALRWVNANIDRFGGDPGNVTLFGESAGATSVCMLLAMPEARGLFARAISQSAPVALTLPSADDVASTTGTYLGALALSLDTSERLLTVPSEALMRAQAVVEREPSGWPHFFPVASTLYGGQPGDAIARASTAPLIIGYNRDEWNLFAIGSLPAWDAPMADVEIVQRLQHRLPTDKADAAASVVEAYRTSRHERGLPHHNRALWRALEGDLRFRVPSLRFAELYQTQAETYFYNFTYASPALRGALGACHALELPFVFGTYDAPSHERFAGKGERVISLSAALMACWCSFARGEAPRVGATVWPRYELTSRATMELDAPSALVPDSFGAERAAWEGVI